MRRTAARIVTAVTVAVLSLPAAAGAAWPGRNGLILFSAPSRGDVATGCDTASMRPDGSAYNCIDYFRYDPAVSRDNRHIVGVEGDQPADLFGMNFDGTGVRRFTRVTDGSTQNVSPAFSPDGRQIVFTKAGSSADGVYVMNSDGSGQRLLLTPGQDAVYSPSGTQLAYGGDGLHVSDVNGNGARMLAPNHNDHIVNGFTVTTYVEYNREPNWSPNGRQIVFTRESHLRSVTCSLSLSCTTTQRVDSVDVFLINADGTGLRRLTSTPGFDEEDPHFSPDGTQIAYYKQDALLDVAHGQIWVMRADGGAQHMIAHGANPEWTTAQGGPSKPRLQFTFRKLNRRSTCLGTLDGYLISVRTNASRKTQFDVSDYVDGKFVEKEYNTRGYGNGVDLLQLRRGRHHLRVVVEDAVIHDRISRTFAFRRC